MFWFISTRASATILNKTRLRLRAIPVDNGFNTLAHDDFIKWKHFTRYWPFVRESCSHRWILLTKASDAELWYFCYLCLDGWANNRGASDLTLLYCSRKNGSNSLIAFSNRLTTKHDMERLLALLPCVRISRCHQCEFFSRRVSNGALTFSLKSAATETKMLKWYYWTHWHEF